MLEHTVYHHNESRPNSTRYAGRKHVREAGAFLTHVVARYNTLAPKTAFIHEDIWLHNPVWPHWLACLRPTVTHASLSPIWQPAAPAGAGILGQVLGANTSNGGPVPWSCCFLIVEKRATLQITPKADYEAARSMLEAGNRNGAAVTAFHLENAGHLMRPLSKNWLQPCTNFLCELPRCKQVVGYVKLAGPFSHGIPMYFESNALRDWQERACGVRNIVSPETLRLASVRREVVMPCSPIAFGLSQGSSGSMMQTLIEVHNRTGCHAPRANRLRSWMTAVTSKYAQSFAGHPREMPSARIAVFPLKGPMCTGLVRCWQACCAECSRHASWCVAWEWTLAGTCSLSDKPAVMAEKPSFDRVIGGTVT